MSTVALHFYVDTNGLARATSGDYTTPKGIIGAFLESDIQKNCAFCDELLALNKDVVNGKLPSASMGGNAYDVDIGKDGVTIGSIYAESPEPPTILLTHHEFSDILTQWKLFIAQLPRSGQST